LQTLVLLGHRVAAPFGQVREQPAPSQRQVALLVKVIVQAPVHWAPQSAELLHVMVLPAPTFSSQSAALLQTKPALPAAVRSHFAVLLQATLDPCATVPLHTEVVPHASSALGATTTMQVPAVQPHWVPVQEQPAPSHVGVDGTGAPQPENTKTIASRLTRMRPV